jgi:hypothetical protein
MEDSPHAGHLRRRERNNTGTIERLSFLKLNAEAIYFPLVGGQDPM